MPTSFSLTFDSTHNSLVLVAEESIVDDIVDIRITKAPTGFDCEVTRAGGGTPVRLVAEASPAGRQAMERANGRISSSAPGFVEVSAPAATPVSSLAEDLARCLGWEGPSP